MFLVVLANNNNSDLQFSPDILIFFHSSVCDTVLPQSWKTQKYQQNQFGKVTVNVFFLLSSAKWVEVAVSCVQCLWNDF